MPTIAIRQSNSADTRRSETQGMLVIDEAPAAGQAFIGLSLLGAGAINVEGTYRCYIDTYDWSALEAIVKPSAVTGTVTPYLRRMYANRKEIRDTAATGIAFVAGTRQVLSTTTVIGTQRFCLDIVVAAAGAITFDPGTDPTAQTALGEFNGA